LVDAPVVKALQAMRGVALVVAVTIVAEVGDFRRFANARQLMAYLGLVVAAPSPRPATPWPGARRGVDLPHECTGQPQACTTVSSRCPRPSKTLRGKRRSDCARDIADWPPPASPRSWSSPRSRAIWPALFGRSPASPSRLSIDRPAVHPRQPDRVVAIRRWRDQRSRDGAKDCDPESGAEKPLWICRCAWTTLPRCPQLRRANIIGPIEPQCVSCNVLRHGWAASHCRRWGMIVWWFAVCAMVGTGSRFPREQGQAAGW
jgi:Transposase IS116/IS110/IS902 family